MSENNILQLSIISITPSGDSRSSVPFWLDAKDEIKEGEWIWGSGARLFLNDSRWAPGQPNNHGDGQHCLIVDYDKSQGFDKLTVGLEDNPCHLSFNIMCEYTPKITYQMILHIKNRPNFLTTNNKIY